MDRSDSISQPNCQDVSESELVKLVRDVYACESQAVANAWKSLKMDQFNKACELLLHARRIGASGCGHSGFACMHFVHLMCCIQRPARFLYPSEALHGELGFLHKGDVMLLCSRSGRTEELLPIREACRRKDVRLITVTEDAFSPLARHADAVLKVPFTREVDRFNTQGTSSFAVANVLFDALQAALIEKVGFTMSQYALDHPGGAVGERLRSELEYGASD